jgi:epoxyqueuosine reductase
MGRTAWLQRERSEWLKEQAKALGFEAVGIARAGYLEEEAAGLEAWLRQGFQGEMSYLERNIDLRLDPRLLHPGTRSVVSLAYNYYTDEVPQDPDSPRIARYAYGQDYHHVLKARLRQLLDALRERWGEVAGRAFVDSAPLHERAWARRAGVGWTGKNSLTLSKGRGSYFFLAELLLDVDLEPDAPVADHCGTCTRCIDACPTGAIIRPQVVDGSRCISYFTIELKGAIPEPVAAQMGHWAFGCDVCQEVCPWNRHARPHTEPAWEPHPRLMEMTRSDWEEISEEVFREVFRRSAVKRAGYQGLRRNLSALGLRLRTPDPNHPRELNCD